MTIRRVVDPAFTMEITNSRLAKILERLNSDGDDKLDLNDIQFPVAGASDQTRLQLMRELVTGAFEESGFNDGQSYALFHFFDLAERVNFFSDAVREWQKKGKTLYDKDATNGLRLPQSACLGNLMEYETMVDRFGELTRGLFGILGLAGDSKYYTVGYEDLVRKGRACGGKYVGGFEYDERAIPKELRKPVARVVERYLKSASYFVQFDSIICHYEREGDRRLTDEYHYKPVIRTIKAGTKNQLFTETYNSECPQKFARW